MSDELSDFLRAGLEKFPEAYRAVQEFTEALEERLSERLAKASLGSFKVTGKPIAGVGRDHREGCWIYAWIAGKVGTEAARVEVGLWWEAPEWASPVVYLRAMDGPEWLRGLEEPTLSARISRRTMRRKTYFIVEPARPLDPKDIVADVDLLLQAFTRAVSRAGKPAGGAG